MKVSDLTEQEVSSIIGGFRYFDQKNTGFIARSQFGTALRWLKLIPSEAQIEALLKVVDPNNSGKVSMEMFLAAAAELWYGSQLKLETEAWNAFLMFDLALTGSLHKDVLMDILTQRGSEPIPVKEAEQLLKRFVDSRQRVEYSMLIKELLR
ncbi:unnamed protein product [Dicrocoelium dendriticum]|nr:unnamed protein product [Dicrocoelium dendriticum]